MRPRLRPGWWWSECWDSRAEHISFHRAGDSWWPWHVPWLYPNSAPSDDPSITTKSSPYLLGLSTIPGQGPSSPDIPKAPLNNLQAVHVLEWRGIQVGTQSMFIRWMTVFKVVLLPSMSLSPFTQKWFHCIYTKTMPKQWGRKTFKCSSLPKTDSCLWHCRKNEPVVSDGCVIQLWEDEHSIKIWGYSLGQVTNSTFFESSFFIFFWHLKWVNQGNGKC